MSKRLIIGLAGNPGSGKTALAAYLAAHHGFYHFEGSTGIRELAELEDIELSSRKDYSDFHRKIQKQHGPYVLADRLLARSENKLVYAGIRSVAYAQRLQQAGGVIIALNSPVETRFSRVNKTGLKYEDTLKAFR